MKKQINCLILTVAIITIGLLVTTCKREHIPAVKTNYIRIDSCVVNASGTIVDVGEEGIQDYGFCWSINPEPRVNGSSKSLGYKLDPGAFYSKIEGLSENASYYIRSFANSGGLIIYGDQFFVQTPQLAVSDLTATVLSESSVMLLAQMTSTGLTPVTSHGFCWVLTGEPTIYDSIADLGPRNSTGSFNYTLTGLTPGYSYNSRAFAVNGSGVVYSPMVNFTTNAIAPEITTDAVTNILSSTATCGGNVITDNGSPVTLRGVCWSNSQNPTTTDPHTTDGIGTGTFTSSLTGLTPGATYYVRAYATNGIGTSYGNEVSFNSNPVLPIVTTTGPTNVTSGSATSGGDVTYDGGTSVISRGVCWGTSQNPTISGTHTTDGNGTGIFTSSLTGLVPGDTYYLRAYATNSVGTAYGNEISFSSLAVLPTLTTTAASNITSNTATSGGNISYDGGASITSRGVCWSTSHNPTIADPHSTDGTGTGVFPSSITGLLPGGTYYVRAYATNSAGTAYGNEVSLTTDAVLPTISTNSITNVSSATSTGGGNVTNDGGSVVTARGVCWNTSPTPTIANSHTTDGAGIGTFTSSITGLSPGVTYYVRAYATNSVGTAYGNEVSFNTNAVLPTITTNAASNINVTTATSGGNISNDGGAAVTARGVCWNTSPTPTTANFTTSDGTGIGAFTSSLTGLTTGTTYYVRAYATNSVGTVYGNEISFTTWSIPAVTTNSITAITNITSTGGGNVTNDGGTTVTVRGICWNTSPNPTTANSVTSDGTGTGTFTSSLTGLSGNTTYYVRAYATNSVGTAYGNEVSFTTIPNPVLPTITTTSATSIAINTATSGGNVTNDGGATVTARGVCWNTAPTPTTANFTTSDGTGTGAFASSLSGLTANTTYYVRAYATNSVGTAYGNEISFTTMPNPVLPVITTNSISAITTNSSTGGGNITSDGGAAVNARGVCWNTSPTPTTANFTTSDGTGIGAFVSSLTGLSPNTTYYVRAYATNSVGTAYGNEVSFTTQAVLSLPTVTTDAISSITTNSSTGGGNVISDGGASVSARGVCWNTSPTPTTANFTTSDGTGTGAFGSSLTGLSANTTYYVRAYATNSVGTAYGNEVSFITTIPHSIGDFYQGGIIFYIDGTGAHGLIVTESDQNSPSGDEWGCDGTYIGGTSTGINTGSSNTNTIVAGCTTPGISADLCYDLVLNGYSDWYLPSFDELSLLQPLFDNGTIGLSDEGYWSSSESSSDNAWRWWFGAGSGSAKPKFNTFKTRAIRSF